MIAHTALCDVPMRSEGRPASAYSARRLASHFRRLVVSSGTRPLRIVSLMGIVFACIGVFVSIFSVVRRILGDIPVEGWTSVFVAVLVVGGAILFALGIIAEYIAASSSVSMGKPLYVIVQDPADIFDDEPS